jgi:hypothetical protein
VVAKRQVNRPTKSKTGGYKPRILPSDYIH